MRPFLTARWSNLCLLTYAVPDELLLPRLPAGLELDRRDGSAFVSLVAFDFRDTRVLGVRWPGLSDFAEVNLRYYVRRGADRGVMFIREFVPSRLVAWMARALYNEPYRATPMQSVVGRARDAIEVEHRLEIAGRTHTIRMSGQGPAACPAENSIEHFFKEHRWGFGRTRAGRPVRYEVRHPTWKCYRVCSFDLDLDWSAVYGPEWGFLSGRQPYSTVLAVGSPVSVFPASAVLS